MSSSPTNRLMELDDLAVRTEDLLDQPGVATGQYGQGLPDRLGLDLDHVRAASGFEQHPGNPDQRVAGGLVHLTGAAAGRIAEADVPQVVVGPLGQEVSEAELAGVLRAGA